MSFDRTGKHTIETLINSSPIFTSVIEVQGHQRVNIGIGIGSVTSADAASVVISAFSGVITLQRQMPGDEGDYWRDVQAWSILDSDGLAGATEVITDKEEPETVLYRVGCKTGEFESGLAKVRLGTS